MLSSPKLGLVAKVDLVEGIGGQVRPVDTKRGSPPDTPERSWEPERIQLCVQGLMLREGKIGAILDHGVDSVAIVDLGDAETRGVERFEFMGRSTPLPRGGAQIV